MRVLVGLLRPDRGEIRLDGRPINYGSPRDVSLVRERLAIVFQQYNLFQNMNVLQNVTVAPIKIRGRKRQEVEPKAEALLARVGLSDKLRAYPDELSGGQQQRVAIARALALEPEILLLDEVTSALDPELVGEVLDVIQGLAADGITMLIVSHEMAFIRRVASNVALLADGALVEQAHLCRCSMRHAPCGHRISSGGSCGTDDQYVPAALCNNPLMPISEIAQLAISLARASIS